MIDQIFIDSNFNKFEKLFFKKNVSDIITLLDENDNLIDNVIYLKMDNKYIGIYINGTNPYFSKSFIEDIDMFNLYENYRLIKTNVKNHKNFMVNSIQLTFNSDYNELIGFYFSNNTIKEKSFSVIFMSDELDILEKITFEEHKNKIESDLLHIENKKTFSINEKSEKWISE